MSNGKNYWKLRHSLLGGAVYFNPDIHCTYIPKQFLQRLKSDSDIIADKPQKVITAGIRLTKCIQDSNTDPVSRRVLTNIYLAGGTNDALADVLNSSRRVLEHQALNDYHGLSEPSRHYDDPFVKKPHCERYEISLEHCGRINDRIEEIAGNNKVKSFHYLDSRSSLGRRLTAIIPVMYSIEKLKESKQLTNFFSQYSHKPQKFYNEALEYCGVDDKKYSDVTIDNFCNAMNVLNKAYTRYGAYVTLQHFNTFSTRYNQIDKTMLKNIQISLQEMGRGRFETDTQNATLSALADAFSFDAIKGINAPGNSLLHLMM